MSLNKFGDFILFTLFNDTQIFPIANLRQKNKMFGCTTTGPKR